MLQLNDDCLCQIFGELKLKDQLIQCAVCPRFKSLITNMVWRRKYRELPPSNAVLSEEIERLSNSEYQLLFTLIVEKMEKLTIADLSHWAFASYLGRFTNRPNFEWYMYFKFPNLQVFNCRDTRIYDDYIRILAIICPKLVSLRITSSYATGAFIKNMRNLRELYAPNCAFSAENLKDIITNLNLTHLNITKGTTVEAGLLTEATKLQELELSAKSIDTKFVENIQNLRGLRILRIFDLTADNTINWTPFFESVGCNINSMRIMNTSSYTALVDIIAEHLPLLSNLVKLHLKVSGEFPAITKFVKLTTLKELHLYNTQFLNELLVLIENCNDLEHIYLDSFIGGFPNVKKWILDIIGVMEKQPTTRKLLTIHAVQQEPDDVVYKKLYQEIIWHSSYLEQTLLKFQLTNAEEHQTQLETYDVVEFIFKSS